MLSPLLFYIYFRISLSMSTKMPLGILIGFALSLQITLGRIDILAILSISIHEYIYLYLGLLFKSLSNTVFFFPKSCKTFPSHISCPLFSFSQFCIPLAQRNILVKVELSLNRLGFQVAGAREMLGRPPHNNFHPISLSLSFPNQEEPM